MPQNKRSKQFLSVFTTIVFTAILFCPSIKAEANTNYLEVNNLTKALTIADSLTKSRPYEALSYLALCVREAKWQKKQSDLMKFYYLQSKVSFTYHKYNESQKYSDSGMVIALQIKDYKYKGLLTINNGLLIAKKNNYDAALKYFFDALKLGDQIRNDSLIADSRNYIGIFDYILHNYDDALIYCNSALQIAAQKKYLTGEALAYEHLCIIYIKLKKYDKAESYGLKAIQLARFNNDKIQEIGVLETLSVLFKNQEKYQKALGIYKDIYNLRNQIGVGETSGFILSNMGDIYSKMKEYEKARTYLSQAIALLENSNDLRALINATDDAYANSLKMKDYRGALHFLESYRKYNDSLKTLEISQKTKDMQLKYESEKKDNEIMVLQKNKEADEERVKFLIIALILLIVLFIVSLQGYFIKKRSLTELSRKNFEIADNINELEKLNAHLVELSKEKDKFLSIIAHDLKSPFQGLLGISQLLYTDIKEFGEKELHSITEKLFFTTKKLYELLDNLLYWGRLNSERINFFKSKVELATEADRVKNLYIDIANEKKVDIQINIPSDLIIVTDQDSIQLVLRNMVSNAIKFSHVGGKIVVDSFRENGTCTINISDNGIGMSQEKVSTLFTDEMQSSMGTNSEKGTALGLHICKELIEKNNGMVSVQSAPEQGTTFTIKYPIE